MRACCFTGHRDIENNEAERLEEKVRPLVLRLISKGMDLTQSSMRQTGRAYPDALYRVGLYYESGLVVDQSYEKAAVYYRLGADQGDPGSRVNLGILYLNGLGVELSYEKAYELFRLAADQENALGYANLGLMYYGY